MLKPEDIILTLNQAAEVNLSCRLRQGNIIRLPDTGKVIMTGDLHGSEKNFDRIVDYADLAGGPDRHLVIHELIHDPYSTNPHECHSYNLLIKAAQLVTKFPGQVHYLLGNHAMAQVTSEEVLKAGKPMVKSLNKGMVTAFGLNYLKVYKALENFILSMALVAKTANNIWMSHSLPDAGHFSKFDYSIFDSKLSLELLKSSNSIRALLWDRKHSSALLHEMSRALQIDSFIVGHQPQPEGSKISFERLIILASDHNLGTVLPFDLSRKYTTEELFGNVIKIARL